MINITYRNETISFLEFSSVLNIHEYFKEKLVIVTITMNAKCYG